ncbi:MAG: hypothetical protein HZA81_03675 [Candidatus Taylorbacteria bacterium]|nr:hypothetical protein [Candidatus Taylorbacteria bacterium]
MSGMPDWMREDFERGCARIRGRVATMQILADDALAHQESRMAMANQ